MRNPNVRNEADAAARAGMLCAAAMIAHQVGGKATRDAFFLTSFAVTALPTMLVVSALVSLGFVLAASRAMTALGPARLVPLAFGASGALLLAEWALALEAPRAAAIAVYIHLASFGSVLISGFWSLASERFDPRTAKKQLRRIAGAATLGGLLGGLTAERVAALSGVASMLPLLAVLHFACAVLLRGLGSGLDPSRERDASGAARPGGPAAAFRLVRASPFLRSLACLVLAGSVGGTLVDYVFKSDAVAVQGGGAQLLRFFAAFYTATGLLAFLVQVALGQLSLERLGLARTVTVLPLALVAGGVGSLLVPGLASAAAMRGTESVARGSLYRLGYELLFVPLAPAHQRATKALLDVGLDRIGEVLGGSMVALALVIAPWSWHGMLAGLIVAIGLALLWIVQSVSRGYREALKSSLLSRAEQLGVVSVPVPILGAADPLDTGAFLLSVGTPAPGGPRESAPPAAAPAVVRTVDPLVSRFEALRSGHAPAVRAALGTDGPLDSLLVGQVISLLAWDEVSTDAVRVLSASAPRIVGQLADALLDPQQEFAIRRRIPRVLAEARSQRAFDALVVGLDDRRFEVRYACGRALARCLANDAELRIDGEHVHAIVLREAATDKTVWESRRLLDAPEEPTASSWTDDLVRSRGSRSLEHVFRLLSFALPGEPLRVAFRGLHTDDEVLRGTALEYLESVLPAAVRERLWPFLEQGPAAPRQSRPREEILEALLRSHSSIELNLAALRERQAQHP